METGASSEPVASGPVASGPVASGPAASGPVVGGREVIGAEELAGRLGTEDAPVLVDVREPEEFSDWAIDGALNVPLSTLADHLTTVRRYAQAGGREHEVVVVCASGQRAAVATEALRRDGVDAETLVGGMEAWSNVYDVVSTAVGELQLAQVRRRGKGCLSYVVGGGDEALVVDPSSEIDRYLELASSMGRHIVGVVDTHLHADHLSGARALSGAVGCDLYLSSQDGYHFDHEPVDGGEQLELGDQAVTFHSTPGHTPGSVMVDLDGQALLTGDILFVDGVGRPDLAEEAPAYAAALYGSLRATFERYGGDVAVLPAHFGPRVHVAPRALVSSTLDEVRRSVPELDQGEERFVEWSVRSVGKRPPRYEEIVRANSGALHVDAATRHLLEAGPNRCAVT